MHKKDALGRYGEELAVRHLRRNGWQVLERNWRCSIGEIDIIAVRGSVLAVCEVKTRRSSRFGSPLEAVTPEKAQRLRRLAAQWVAMARPQSARLRVDVVSVLVDDAGHTHVQHVEGVC